MSGIDNTIKPPNASFLAERARGGMCNTKQFVQMLTDQNYVGKVNNAPTNPQTAQKSVSPPQSLDEGQYWPILEHLLTCNDDPRLAEIIRLASQPAVTSIKSGVVISAIVRAFQQGAFQAAPKPVTELPKPQWIDPDVYRIQSELLELVDDFLSVGNVSEPIEAINDLLYRWLTTSAVDLSREVNRNQLHTALQLVNFLTALYEQNENRHLFINIANEKGGQDNE